MLYPINFDFGNNWRKKIAPHLDHPKIKSAIRKGVNAYFESAGLPNKYKPNTPPAIYSSKDGYVVWLMEKWEQMFEALKDNNMVPKEIIELDEIIANFDSDGVDDYGYDVDDYCYDAGELEEKFRQQFFTWDEIKYDLESYYFSGACFWWAPTFELELAKLVEPNETWRVQRSDIHATVINEDKTKIFDLLYWVCDGRMENYLFGTEIKKPDPTLGGKQAYLDSL